MISSFTKDIFEDGKGILTLLYTWAKRRRFWKKKELSKGKLISICSNLVLCKKSCKWGRKRKIMMLQHVTFISRISNKGAMI